MGSDDQSPDFFVDLLTTALRAGEILREIVFLNRPAFWPCLSEGSTQHGFAVVGVAVALQIGANGSCESTSVGITGVASKLIARRQSSKRFRVNRSTIKHRSSSRPRY
jgi:CO/xanthine dehydrogenase FAD-binding subunit